MRRKLRQKFDQVLNKLAESKDYPFKPGETVADVLTDAAMEVFMEKPKVDTSKMGLDWKILAGDVITQEQIDNNVLDMEARDTFEKDMGFNPLPWASTKVWEKFGKFVVQEYKKNKLIFAMYKTWQKSDKGKYLALSNRSIKQRPEDFIACFPDFLASIEMYPIQMPNVSKADDDQSEQPSDDNKEIYI